jgi:hypothetical protein
VCGGIYVNENPRVLTAEMICGSVLTQIFIIFSTKHFEYVFPSFKTPKGDKLIGGLYFP